MKTQSSGFREVRRSSVLFGLLMAGVALLNPGSLQRCAAQFPPPPAPPNMGYAADENTFSIGVAQIQVDPNFTNLFSPATPTDFYYPGFSPGSGVLTSPTMYDSTTVVGSSPLYLWDLSAFNPAKLPWAYPVTVGYPVGTGFGTAAGAPWNSVGGANYFSIPTGFAVPVNGYQMIVTEIEMFDLSCSTASFACGNDARVPSVPVQLDMVTAGPNSGNGVAGAGGLGTDLTRRSIGMVQQASAVAGSPAQSFFNIYVQLNLPAVTGNGSTVFPISTAYSFGIARLTNAYSDPLVITNLEVTNLPPGVVYIHGQTTAVPLYFKDNNPPYWNAGDRFGALTLAGHGVFGCTNDASGQPGHSNCCAQANTAAVLDVVLGPIGNPKPPMPVPWSRATNSFPTPSTSIKSIVNTTVSSGVTNILDDTLSFQGFPFAIRGLTLGNFTNSVPPPPPHATATVTCTNVPLTYTLLVSGTPFQASGTGTVSMVISNTGSWSSTLIASNPPPVTNFTVRISSLVSRCTSTIGPTFLRVDPLIDNLSLGEATIRKTTAGYDISFYDDARLQISTDNVNYFGAVSNRTMRLLPSLPAATAPVDIPPTVSVHWIGTNVVLNWIGVGTLQSASSLSGTVDWISLTSSNTAGPYTNPVKAGPMFFRLKRP